MWGNLEKEDGKDQLTEPRESRNREPTPAL